MPGFLPADGESQGEKSRSDRDHRLVCFCCQPLGTRPEDFCEGWQGDFDDGLTPRPGKSRVLKHAIYKGRNRSYC
jgi:hypothetical protein